MEWSLVSGTVVFWEVPRPRTKSLGHGDELGQAAQHKQSDPGARQTWYPGMRLQSAEPNRATSASSGQQDPERAQLSTGLRDEEGVQEKEREGCFGQRAEHPRGL